MLWPYHIKQFSSVRLSPGHTLESPGELFKNSSDWTVAAEIQIHEFWIGARVWLCLKSPPCGLMCGQSKEIPAVCSLCLLLNSSIKVCVLLCIAKDLLTPFSTRSKSQLMTFNKINNKQKLWNYSFSLKAAVSLRSRPSAQVFSKWESFL